ncbi:MAG TPA: rhodanese-like domain-containing protein [Steroidobacteraceae bacterium]|nr:rhodanese-like domain-containing protein [Steroidobacteraceae bacterium]
MKMTRLLTIICLSSICAAALADGPVSKITPAELFDDLSAGEPDPVVLDVRTPEEFAAGHVPGAMNIPHDQIAERIASLEPARGAELVVYCRSGRRSAIASDVLRQAGFDNVRHLAGDMQGWQAAELPLETEQPIPSVR